MIARHVRVSTLALVFAAAGPPMAVSAGGNVADDEAVIRALPSVQHSLLEAVRATARSPVVAISARFEDDGKGLSLSVYTARRGTGIGAETNVFREHAGDATRAVWKPTTESFADVLHVARASEQLTLMRTTELSLSEAISAADAKLRPLHDAVVYSITPTVQDGKGVFLVGVAVAGGAYRLVLDLRTCTALAPWPKMPKRPLPTPLLEKLLPEPVIGEGTWIGSAPPTLAETVGKRVVLVVSNSYG